MNNNQALLESTELVKQLIGVYAGVFMVVLIISIIGLVAMMKIFSKAGIAGWKVLIPFYGNYLSFELVFGNGWLFLLNLVPFVGYVLPLIFEFKLAKVFGKGTGFAILSMFFSPITRLIIAFGDCEYERPMQ